MALACGCDPTASRTGWGRNSDEEQRVVAGGRDARDLAGEVSVTLRAERNGGCVENGGRRGAGIANQGAGDGRNRAGRAAGIAAIEDQAIHVKERVPVGQVHSCVPIANGPGACTGMDACNWIINARSGNHADDAVPTYQSIAFDPGKCRCGA